MEQLDGKVAVITGGASGIGRAMARRFRSDGMTVVIADVEQAALDATASDLGVEGVRTDVSDADSVAALADTVIERHGAVHLVCNNAGVGGGGRIANQTLKDWQWVIEVNLWGVIHGLHTFLPLLLANEDGGHIVNTASMAGLAPWPGIGVYNATKYAVVGISETLAIELQGTKVGVSVLCPGVVNTNIFQSQRNRPQHLRNPARNTEARQFNDGLAVQTGIDAGEVADKVSAAVRSGEFWIITHPDLLAAVQQRHEGLMRHAAVPPT
ncbi:MAG: family NAD(P)-dependent oxidoreductase [Ilumatobacteraceae bacterium]|nr:family NAD(P)-dependent oxidoreductase [Ilumatobacteraceae bacterium]